MMKKPEFQTTTKSTAAKRFFNGKGFYVALAVSLAAVGGAAWLGVNSAMNKLNAPTPENTVSQAAPKPTVPQQEVTVPKNDVPAQGATPDAKAKAKAEAEAKAKAEADASKNNSAANPGYILPLKGDVLNGYSGDKVVKSKTLDDWVMHTGIDIAAAVSTPVKSMSAGKIVAIENDALWGTTVTVSHQNGIISYYANLKSAVNVKKGQEVKLGDVIGAVGDTCDIERAEGSHLHFGVKKNDNWIDPFSLIQ